MIQIRNLTKRFGDLAAVDDLTLDVEEGEVFGFLGPNGAGKTTTVRMLTCLVGPTSGQATVNGLQVGRDDTAIRRSVGILTETPGLYDRLSAEKNLTIFANLYEVKDVAGQVECAARRVRVGRSGLAGYRENHGSPPGPGWGDRAAGHCGPAGPGKARHAAAPPGGCATQLWAIGRHSMPQMRAAVRPALVGA